VRGSSDRLGQAWRSLPLLSKVLLVGASVVLLLPVPLGLLFESFWFDDDWGSEIIDLEMSEEIIIPAETTAKYRLAFNAPGTDLAALSPLRITTQGSYVEVLEAVDEVDRVEIELDSSIPMSVVAEVPPCSCSDSFVLFFSNPTTNSIDVRFHASATGVERRTGGLHFWLLDITNSIVE